ENTMTARPKKFRGLGSAASVRQCKCWRTHSTLLISWVECEIPDVERTSMRSPNYVLVRPVLEYISMHPTSNGLFRRLRRVAHAGIAFLRHRHHPNGPCTPRYSRGLAPRPPFPFNAWAAASLLSITDGKRRCDNGSAQF